MTLRKLFGKKETAEISKEDVEVILKVREVLKAYEYKLEIDQDFIIIKVKREEP